MKRNKSNNYEELFIYLIWLGMLFAMFKIFNR